MLKSVIMILLGIKNLLREELSFKNKNKFINLPERIKATIIRKCELIIYFKFNLIKNL